MRSFLSKNFAQRIVSLLLTFSGASGFVTALSFRSCPAKDPLVLEILRARIEAKIAPAAEAGNLVAFVN
jgi:hypothetical protein